MMEALLSSMNTELSEDQRIVIILRFLEDFSLKGDGGDHRQGCQQCQGDPKPGIAKLKKPWACRSIE
jgi:hypothetical protein